LEQPISFFSRALRDAEKRYDIMEKQAYASVKSLKTFRIYILQLIIISHVPSTSLKEILIQPDIDGKRSKLITNILEFDLEIKPTRLLKGQGLAKLLAESNCEALVVNFMNIDSEDQHAEIFGEDPHLSQNLAGCP
jgi:hypothetical protein